MGKLVDEFRVFQKRCSDSFLLDRSIIVLAVKKKLPKLQSALEQHEIVLWERT